MEDLWDECCSFCLSPLPKEVFAANGALNRNQRNLLKQRTAKSKELQQSNIAAQIAKDTTRDGATQIHTDKAKTNRPTQTTNDQRKQTSILLASDRQVQQSIYSLSDGKSLSAQLDRALQLRDRLVASDESSNILTRRLIDEDTYAPDDDSDLEEALKEEWQKDQYLRIDLTDL